MKKQYQDIITRNEETGEIIETERTIKYPTEENYIKLYLDHLALLNNFQSTDVIFSLLKYMNYKNEIVINSSIKRQIAEETGKKFQTINQLMTKLVQQEILLRKDIGIYLFNPYIFGKGDWKDIYNLRQSVELKITFSPDEISYKTKIKKDKSIEKLKSIAA